MFGGFLVFVLGFVERMFLEELFLGGFFYEGVLFFLGMVCLLGSFC